MDPSPTYSTTAQPCGLPHPGEHLSLYPLLHNRHTNTHKKMAQKKEQFKAPEKIQLSNEEIANLSDAEFKTLIIRMLTELIEFSHKVKEQMKVTQSEIKENVQGTNSDWKETRTQTNSLEQKE